MNFVHAAAALCIGTLLWGAGPSAANEVSQGVSASTAQSVNIASTSAITLETEAGFVATQGRGGRGFRGGGGRGFAAVGPRRRGNFGRNAAIGIGAAVIGGIIVNEAVRSRGGNSCSRWNYQCNNGSGSACRNLDRYC